MVSLKSRTCAVGPALAMRRSAKPHRIGMGSNQKGDRPPHTVLWSMPMADLGSDSVPEEIEEPCTRCHYALSGIEQTLKPILAASRLQAEQQVRKK